MINRRSMFGFALVPLAPGWGPWLPFVFDWQGSMLWTEWTPFPPDHMRKCVEAKIAEYGPSARVTVLSWEQMRIDRPDLVLEDYSSSEPVWQWVVRFTVKGAQA